MGKPMPIAVAISGRWIDRHSEELAEIKKMYLNITWVNHSYSHTVENDFLNNPKVDFRHEVEHNIEVMKKYGLKPSNYFRFPGLRHNAERLKELKAMGFINLDADAWLGKGQKTKEGSIVLIHGNGNERPEIVKRFVNYLKSREQDIIQGRLQIVPLSDNKLLI
jgi:peptidoglycan/xylan/chitin deacetylase (PgdA/CDA1 family)